MLFLRWKIAGEFPNSLTKYTVYKRCNLSFQLARSWFHLQDKILMKGCIYNIKYKYKKEYKEIKNQIKTWEIMQRKIWQRVSGKKYILNRIRSTVSWQGIPLENVKIERGYIYQVDILASFFCYYLVGKIDHSLSLQIMHLKKTVQLISWNVLVTTKRNSISLWNRNC